MTVVNDCGVLVELFDDTDVQVMPGDVVTLAEISERDTEEVALAYRFELVVEVGERKMLDVEVEL